jgi:hypothetical protein
MTLKLAGHSGAAFLLQSPSDENLTIEHPSGSVEIRAAAPYVTAALLESVDSELVRDESYRIVQEALDVHAARTRRPLATSHGDLEYITWRRTESGYLLIASDTAVFPWAVNATIQVSGPTVPTPPLPFVHHASLRYYRLSQLSEDLFDAYRNAYLALEYLVSSESPKAPSESELNWLKRVINGPLASGIPNGLVAGDLLDAIYKDGRLPLFHAKTGATFFAPHGAERAHIQNLFSRLTLLLVALLQHKFGHSSTLRWGEMSQEMQDAQARASLDTDGLILLDGAGNSIQLCEAVCDIFESPRRFGQFWARITAPVLAGLAPISGITSLLHGEQRFIFSFPEAISMLDVSHVGIEINTIAHNIRSPKRNHPR